MHFRNFCLDVQEAISTQFTGCANNYFFAAGLHHGMNYSARVRELRAAQPVLSSVALATVREQDRINELPRLGQPMTCAIGKSIIYTLLTGMKTYLHKNPH